MLYSPTVSSSAGDFSVVASRIVSLSISSSRLTTVDSRESRANFIRSPTLVADSSFEIRHEGDAWHVTNRRMIRALEV
jgi:hypothetical protein